MLDHLSFGDPVDVDMLDRESRWPGHRYTPELRRLIGARPGRALTRLEVYGSYVDEDYTSNKAKRLNRDIATR